MKNAQLYLKDHAFIHESRLTSGSTGNEVPNSSTKCTKNNPLARTQFNHSACTQYTSKNKIKKTRTIHVSGRRKYNEIDC